MFTLSRLIRCIELTGNSPAYHRVIEIAEADNQQSKVYRVLGRNMRQTDDRVLTGRVSVLFCCVIDVQRRLSYGFKCIFSEENG